MMFSCFRNAKGMALLAAAVVIGGYLVIWHQQHLAVALPFLVFLACPLMHLFMHGGHGGHGGHSGHQPDKAAGPGKQVRPDQS